MLIYSFETGASASVPGIDPITDLSFGARYISYRGINRFLGQTDDYDPGLIVWPGGTLAETRTDRFGFEYDGLYAPETGKPALSDMIEIANAEGAGLSIVVPTLRYADAPQKLAADLSAFLDDLLTGVHGPLPETVILEIGSEYYAHFGNAGGAAGYGTLADTAVAMILLSFSGV